MESRVKGVGIDPEDFEGDPIQGAHVDDPFAQKTTVRRHHRVKMTPSTWVEHFVRIKDGDRGVIKKMDFEERRYLRRIYDSKSPRKLLLTSRQTEKSTTVGNKILANCGMNPGFESLFVSPSAMQTKVFSSARLHDIIDISPLVKSLTHKELTMNILEKVFVNRSKIYLRYAFLNADRIRGLSVNAIFADEIQDLLQETMPVIEETASHRQNPVYVYSGTPKSFDNTIEHYWSKASTQSEWCIPCEHHGTPNKPSTWHWNILGPNNLGKTGPVCDRCGNPLNPEHPMAQWVEMNPGAEFEGFRICRLMVPWYFKSQDKWKEILLARERYNMAQFMNEVLAISYDSGVKPISRAEVIRACDSNYHMDEDAVAALGTSHTLYGGVDWGTGESASYSLFTVGGYVRGDSGFQVVYSQRFDGPLADPELQVAEISRLVRKFRLKYLGCDYGMGFMQNKKLISTFGPKRVHQFQYAPRAPRKLIYRGALHRFIAFRTPLMSDLFNAIKAMKVRLPAWEVYKSPYADDILSIKSEYSETMRMIKYDKPRGIPDDTFHSILYCLMVSMFDHQRPDIIAPIREVSDSEAQSSAAEDAAMMDFEMKIPPNEM